MAKATSTHAAAEGPAAGADVAPCAASGGPGPAATVIPVGTGNGKPPASEAFLLQHLSQHVESVRATVSQQLTWLAFACGANAAVFALYVKGDAHVNTPIVPAVFVLGAATAVTVCVQLEKRYREAGQYVMSLLERFESGLRPPITIDVLVNINRAVAVIVTAMGLGWGYLFIQWIMLRVAEA